MASTDARPIPIKNTAFRAVFPILDADGDLVTGATGLDSEVSKDQGTFADCTNEATEIATASGMYYLDLTSTEMNADCVAVIVKTTSTGAKTTVLVFYPEEAGDINVDVTAWNGTAIPGVDTAGYPKVTIKDGTGTGEIDTTSGGVLVAAIAANAITATSINADAITAAKIADGAIDRATFAADTGLQTIRSGTAQAGAAGTVTLDASASATTDFYKGSWVFLTGGTGAGQARLCRAYNGTTKVATIAPNWATNPDNTSTFAVLPAAGVDLELVANAAVSTSTAQLGVNVVNFGGSAGTFAGGRAEVNVSHWKGTAAATADTAGYPVVTVKDGTGAGEIALTSGAIDTVTALTNAPSDSSGVTTLLTRLSATRAGYLDNLSAGAVALETSVQSVLSKLLKYVQLIVRKDSAIATDNATELTAINANGGSGGGAYANTTDAQEALRDRGDAAWVTATGFSTLDAAGVRTAVGLASANLDTQLTAIDDYIDTEVAAIKAKTDLIPASPAATSDIPSAATIADAVWDEALSGHTTAGSGGKALSDIDTHTDTEVASILAAVDTEVAAIKAKTDQLTFTTANQVDATTMSMAANALTAAATASDFGTEVATAVWASATRTLSALGFTLSASDLAADTIGASELAADAVTEIVNAVLTTAMTESYNADGAAPTLAQAMFLCMQRLTEFAISGTTVTVKKLDGSTTAYTLTLDDATSPTSSTRAT